MGDGLYLFSDIYVYMKSKFLKIFFVRRIGSGLGFLSSGFPLDVLLRISLGSESYCLIVTGWIRTTANVPLNL